MTVTEELRKRNILQGLGLLSRICYNFTMPLTSGAVQKLRFFFCGPLS